MPTLCREYDQHFKAFSDIPVLEKCSSKDENKGDKQALLHAHGIQTRGSRCFEILGLDIMIDEALRPWLIEVNQRPSFGKDTPLDLSIKDRLMSQVLPCLAALSDDEVAFIRHQQDKKQKFSSDQNILKDSGLLQSSDPWLTYEAAILTDFTRLFPPNPNIPMSNLDNCHELNKSDNEEAFVDNQPQVRPAIPSKRTEIASLEDILLKVSAISSIRVFNCLKIYALMLLGV